MFSFSPPAIPGVGTSGGFTFVLEDRAGNDVNFWRRILNTFMAAARKRPEIASLSTTFLPERAAGVRRRGPRQSAETGRAAQRCLPDDSNVHGRICSSITSIVSGASGRSTSRRRAITAPKRNNVGQFYVRNNKGENVPLSALTTVKPRLGPEFTMRYNEYRSAQINGSAAPGYSSDQATAALEEVFKQTMPGEMGFDYIGISYQEQKAREGVPACGGFRVLAAVRLPDSGGALRKLVAAFQRVAEHAGRSVRRVCGLWLRRTVAGWFFPPYMVQIESDVYSQIGLVMLIGLTAKNAILIVEFAKDEYEKGKPLADAALEGARLRLRPILMTSFAFILGCVPLVDRHRRRFRGAPDHGHRGDRRHARRELHRNFSDPGDFLPRREMVRRRQGARATAGSPEARRTGARRLKWTTDRMIGTQQRGNS